MKKIIAIIISSTLFCSILSSTLYAQYDEKFYFPIKGMERINDSINHEDIRIAVECNNPEVIHDTLYSVLIKPNKNNTAIKSTIIYFHGNSGNISSNLPMIMPFVNDGHQVYIWDYRGYGLSTGKPTHNNIISDSQKIFEYILSRQDCKNTPIIIYGASIGSQPAIKIAADNNSKIQALILDGAPSSFKDLVLLYTPKEYKEYVKDFPQPYSAKELIKNIQNIQILVVHSPEDKVIPQSMAEELYNNISPTCKKEYWKYSGEHLDAVRKYPLIFCGKIDNLLKATSK